MTFFAGRRHMTIGLLVIAVIVLAIWTMRHLPTGKAKQIDIDVLMRRMTLEQKIGQMVLAGFPGYEAGAEVKTLVEQYHLGGVILMTRNIRDAEQVTRLTQKLQMLAGRNGAGIPLFIAVDQEGGYVARIRFDRRYPGNMALGAARSPDLTRRVAEAMGREMRAAGINMNFAPVVDVNSNPNNPVIGVRSFGEQPRLVAELGAAYVAGLHDAGVVATTKHFPGHGDTAQDSHIALPTVPHERQRLEQVELYPFREVIAAGTDAIMTAHVTFPAIEPTAGLPATLSDKVLTNLLRQELGFSGLVITDAMEMKAIVNNFGVGEAAVKAVQAGADIVLVGWPDDWRMAVQVFEALTQAARQGMISPERIDTSLRRILEVKQRFQLWDEASWALPLTKEQQTQAQQISEEAALAAITLVRDQNKRLPLEKKQRILVVAPSISGVSAAEDADHPSVVLADVLRSHLETVGKISYPSRPDQASITQIVTEAARYDIVVLATYYAWATAYSGQVQLVQDLIAAGREPIVIALREPYDLIKFPSVGTYLAAYSANPETLAAVAAVLTGKAEAKGLLPVSLPGLYQAP
ncbi:MAG: beta-N-acetylhexosaminidase [Limnochordia bacterium]|jgi:beta-N-acetylhexosaminidase